MIMDAKKVKLVVIKSHCDLYKEGDEIVFDGPDIDKAKSGALCMTALQALYPYVFAGRQGSLWPSDIQCPDCDEGVIFRVVEQ